MHKLTLSAALADYDHTRDLASGRVLVEGVELLCSTHPIEEIFYRALIHREWDVSEVSMAKYVSLRAKGDKTFMAIPVFPSRVFRHGSLFVRRDGPVKKVSDLTGKRVGLPEWAQTAAVYSRGFLVSQFGLDLRSIHWVQAGVNQPGRVEKVELQLPKGIELTRAPDKTLNAMLVSGEIDAMMVARPPASFTAGDPSICRLFEDFKAIEAEYFRKTRIFPIMHTVVIRSEILKANPWVARNLYTAFEEAKRRSIERVLDATASLVPIPWGYEYARRGMELFGEDYFPYGIAPNRTTLEAFLAYAYEQGVCAVKLTPEEIFAPQMAGTYKV